MPYIRLIAAVDDKRGLAKDGRIPWDLPGDTARYRTLSQGHDALMGASTYEKMGSLTSLWHIIVLSRRNLRLPDAEVINDIDLFLKLRTKDLWVLGGGQVYTQALPYATELYLTKVHGDFGCDTFFPDFEKYFDLQERSKPITENGITYHYEVWKPA